MNTIGYCEYITSIVKDLSADKHLTTMKIAGKLSGTFNIEMGKAKKITNVNLKRLADKGELIRIDKGVYARSKITPFGNIPPNKDEILTEILLKENGDTIGYIAGPTLLNVFGLCSLMPKERYITTNRYRRKLPSDTAIRIQRPVTTVTDENVAYLRTLEVFSAMERYHVDAEHPELILRDMLQKIQISNESLIWYARNYYNNQILLRTIDIALGGLQ